MNGIPMCGHGLTPITKKEPAKADELFHDSL